MNKLLVLMLSVLQTFCFTACAQEKDGGEVMEYNKLTPEETRVIVNKGTEAPFSGKYNNHKEVGVYSCKRCNASLYKSEDKFDSRCGWPSFDDEIKGAVERKVDADGRRTEILCKKCGAHLGHVFIGEGMTEKNTRHCVNSISLLFTPEESEKSAGKTETAIFAGGCFWGVEYYFQNLKGVSDTSVGYTGGKRDNPTYKEVCYTDTGHAEALKVDFNPTIVTYEELAKLFFEIHDPTQVDRQGPDIGSQYRSAVFFTNQRQKMTIEKLIGLLEKSGLKVATELVEFEKFWDAEGYHQKYYEKIKKQPYCHRRVKRF